MKSLLSALTFFAGLAVTVVGLWMIYHPLGVIVGGLVTAGLGLLTAKDIRGTR